MVNMEKIAHNVCGPAAIYREKEAYSGYRISIWRLLIPCNFNDVHAFSNTSHSEVILVQIQNGKYSGWGEAVIKERTTGGNVSSTMNALESYIIPSFFKASCATPEDLLRFTIEGMKHPAAQHNPEAFAALEGAILDLAAKMKGMSVAHFLGYRTVKTEFIYSAVLPITSINVTEKLCDNIKEIGIKSVKVKIIPPYEEAIVQRVRKILGDAVELRVDADCSLGRSRGILMARKLVDLGVISLEQPVKHDDLEGLLLVAQQTPIPIMAGESLTSFYSAEFLCHGGKNIMFNLRLSKHGGFQQTMKIKKLADENGIKCQLGSHAGETAVLRAMEQQFLSVQPNIRWIEGGYGKYMFSECPVSPDVSFGKGGIACMREGIGIGVEPDRERLLKYTAGNMKLFEYFQKSPKYLPDSPASKPYQKSFAVI